MTSAPGCIIALLLLAFAGAAGAAPTLRVLTPPDRHVIGTLIELRVTDGPGTPADWVGLFPEGETRDAFFRRHLPIPDDATEATLTLDTQGLAPGRYDLALFDDRVSPRRATASIELVAPMMPRVSMRLAPSSDRGRVAIVDEVLVVGAALAVRFEHANGLGGDWIGVFPEGGADDFSRPLAWAYTNGRHARGSNGRTDGELVFHPLNLPPGRYEARLLGESTCNLRAAAPFEVVNPYLGADPGTDGDLSVVSFNIWRDAQGTGGLDAVVAMLLAAQPDVIALQECSPGALTTILDGLRRDPSYRDATAGEAAFVISRLPITGVAGEGGDGIASAPARAGAVDVSVGDRTVRIVNCHLTAYPYGPYTARDAGGVPRILADEAATRDAEMATILDRFVTGDATVLVGDHNAPSMLDWTAATTGRHFGCAIAWPVSARLLGAGFGDSFRTVHPDPVAAPGFTWTPGAPAGVIFADDVADRIDMIYHRSGRDLALAPAWAAVIEGDPHPSDHRMVIVRFRVRPISRETP
ncbi:MAG: endonuclease/exonuclease/phosphatase family protein [Phycisphaerales bacterium]|nr:endonuclease/exonuclease/phosphatase family protein [Phycisphaerales bacterium]